MLARYEEQLTRLQDALGGGLREGDTECSEAIRDLVETVTVFRDHTRAGGVQVEIGGRLTALLGEQAYPNRVKGVWGKMVAEERLEPPAKEILRFTVTSTTIQALLFDVWIGTTSRGQTH
ncbi:MAG: hypothetical protein WA156_11195 [Methylocystis silviterrae]